MIMIKGIIIGILIYSLMLTVINIYKDNSSYFSVEFMDIIISGPIMWIFILLSSLFIKIYKGLKLDKKEKKRKNRDSKYIQKVVKKIIKNYSSKEYSNAYVDLNRSYGNFEGTIEGWKFLETKSAKYERLNKKFGDLMLHQKEETIKELEKYFVIVPDKNNKYFVKVPGKNNLEYKNMTVYTLKK